MLRYKLKAKLLTIFGDIKIFSGPLFVRWLQELADEVAPDGSDILSIFDASPSQRYTDNLIKLKGGWNIDDKTARHLRNGSIVQGKTIYTSIV